MPLAHRTHPPRAVAARSYLHNAAKKRDRPFFFPGVPSHRNYISIAGQWRKANLTRCPLSHMLGMCCRQRDSGLHAGHERGLWPAKKPLGIMLLITLPVSGLPPFVARPSPRAKGGVLCEAACSPFPRLHAVIAIVTRTNGVPIAIIRSSCSLSGHCCAIPCWVMDAVEPVCSASKGQPPNPMKAGAAPLVDTAYQLLGSG